MDKKMMSFIAFLMLFFGVITYVIFFGMYGKPYQPKLERFFPITNEFKSESTVEVNGILYHSPPEFAFLNQDSVWITKDSMLGNIYVADFFFTRCPGICPKLTGQLTKVRSEYQNRNDIKFLAHSIDPEHDTPQVMKRYAKRFNADWEHWNFVTGTTEQIDQIAQKGYYVTGIPGAGIEMTDHTGKFILVDKEGVIRGYYQGTSDEEVNQLIYDIKVLLLEYGAGEREKKGDLQYKYDK